MLSTMDRSFSQKINKETSELSYTLDRIGLTDIYRTCHPTAAGYTFLFSLAHGTFSRRDLTLGHKTSLNKFRKVEIISSITLIKYHIDQVSHWSEKKSIIRETLKNTQTHGN